MELVLAMLLVIAVVLAHALMFAQQKEMCDSVSTLGQRVAAMERRLEEFELLAVSISKRQESEPKSC